MSKKFVACAILKAPPCQCCGQAVKNLFEVCMVAFDDEKAAETHATAEWSSLRNVHALGVVSWSAFGGAYLDLWIGKGHYESITKFTETIDRDGFAATVMAITEDALSYDEDMASGADQPALAGAVPTAAESF